MRKMSHLSKLVCVVAEGLGWCPNPPAPKGDWKSKISNAGNGTRYLKVAGALTIVSIVFCALIGLIALNAYASYPPRYDKTYGLFIGVFSFIATGFSLTGGIRTLKKENYLLAIASICSIMTSGFLSLLIDHGWMLGTPTLMITTLSLSFVTFSKNEFRYSGLSKPWSSGVFALGKGLGRMGQRFIKTISVRMKHFSLFIVLCLCLYLYPHSGASATSFLMLYFGTWALVAYFAQLMIRWSYRKIKRMLAGKVKPEYYALVALFCFCMSLYPHHSASYDPLWLPLTFGIWSPIAYFSWLTIRWTYNRLARIFAFDMRCEGDSW